MDRAANLFVEQEVSGEALNLIIRAKGRLAEPPRTLVHIEQRAQQVFTFGGGCLNDLALLEDQAHIGDLAARVERREAEADVALGLGLVGAAEDLAVGKILAPVGVDPAPS